MSSLDAFEQFVSVALTTENGKPLKLEPFQREALVEHFDGVRELLLLVSKKAGKSTIMSGRGLYELITVPHAEVAIVAASRDQAGLILKQAHGFIDRSPELRRRLTAVRREIRHRTNGGAMKDYWGVGKATREMLPLIAIPTTAGTGSECQSFALISDETTHQKMACGDPKAAARVAILDPLLTVSQPPRVTACTGIDALAHAVETAVTKKRNPLSAMYSREAFRLCFGALERVLRDPRDLEARSPMQLGAAFAGTAIENSMLGAAHSAANPLTAHYGMAHGQAVGLMLPRVVEFNARDPEAHDRYLDLAILAGLEDVNALISELETLLDVAGLRAGLAPLGVKADALPQLAAEAAQQWTATFNPRPVVAADFERLYAEALGL